MRIHLRAAVLATATLSSYATASLALPASSSNPTSAAVVSSARKAGLSGGDEVTIETRDHQAISGTLEVPRSRSLVPAVLLVHAPGADRKDLDILGERLVKQGFAVLAIDLRGHGTSVSEAFDWSKSDDKGKGTLWALALKDVEAAADYLKSDKRIHSTSLAVVGHGAGCALAARLAVRNENVRAIALVEPGRETLGFDLGADLEELSGLPTMIIVSPEEREAGLSLAQKSSGSTEPGEYVELTVIRKSGVLDDKRLPQQVAKWLDDHAAPRRGN